MAASRRSTCNKRIQGVATWREMCAPSAVQWSLARRGHKREAHRRSGGGGPPPRGDRAAATAANRSMIKYLDRCPGRYPRVTGRCVCPQRDNQGGGDVRCHDLAVAQIKTGQTVTYLLNLVLGTVLSMWYLSYCAFSFKFSYCINLNAVPGTRVAKFRNSCVGIPS
jgi:hypothetical protein